MKFLLLFLALFTPIAWVLWRIAGDFPDELSLEATSSTGPEEAVLDTKDMPYAPVSGELIHLKNFNLQRFHPTENYVLYWVRADRIEKVDGKARVINVTCAVFGEPKDGAENLRIRVVAPYLEGDPSALLSAATDDTQELVLGGGVKVYDPIGRLIAELDRLVINLGKAQISSGSDVHFRDPDRRAELRGKGLESNMSFTDAKILSDVRFTLPLRAGEDELISIASKGAATMERKEESDTSTVTTITLNGGARIQHRDFYGTCDSVRAVILQSSAPKEPKGDGYTVDRVTLKGSVTFDIDPKFAHGLEEFRADEVLLIGEHRVVMSGAKLPVRAVWRGAVEAFGLADRVLDIVAPEIRLHFDRNEKDPLKRIDFLEGLSVTDRAGPGRFAAGQMTYDAKAGTLTARKGAEASGTGRSFHAESAFVSYIENREELHVTLAGQKSLSMRMAGRIGPLAKAANDMYTFTCVGSLVLVSAKGEYDLRASDEVRITSRKAPILSCDELVVQVHEEKTRSLVATGSVEGQDAATGTTINADRLEFQENDSRTVVLDGKPASVEGPERIVRGDHLEYSEGGAFDAKGNVWADVTLPQGRWKFSCDSAEGVAPLDGGSPPRLLIEGGVRADGPGGERLEAERVHFTRKSGRLTVQGSPARLRQGAELSYVGPLLELDVVNGAEGYQVSSGKTGETAKLHVVPKKAPGNPGNPGKSNIASWKVDLRGAAVLKDNVLRIPKGADLEGFDAAGKRVIVVRGSAFEFTLKNQRPVLVRATSGVDVETLKDGKRSTRLVSKGFVYDLSSNSMEIIGPGELWQGAAKEPTRFSEVELEVVPDGVKLKYLKKLEAQRR